MKCNSRYPEGGGGLSRCALERDHDDPMCCNGAQPTLWWPAPCRLCGLDVLGYARKCTCTYTCGTCGDERVGKPNHPGGVCPFAPTPVQVGPGVIR